MAFITANFVFATGDSLVVEVQGKANVVLADSENFERMKKCQECSYTAWLVVESSPLRISPKPAGLWYLMVDDEGLACLSSASFKLIKADNVALN